MATDNNIRAGNALPGAGMATSAPTYDYHDIIGKRLTLQPMGENVSFDAHLPRRGIAVKQRTLGDWGSDWIVLRFDQPFEYDDSVVRECLIRGKWWGCPIGSEFAPVFVLTDPKNHLDTKQSWTSADFEFVNWARVTVDEKMDV